MRWLGWQIGMGKQGTKSQRRKNGSDDLSRRGIETNVQSSMGNVERPIRSYQ